MTEFADRIAGSETAVPVLGGGMRRYANLDHAASTPPFVSVLRTMTEFSEWYANVHRGTGFKSRLSSWAFEEARQAVLRFVGADPATALAIFTRNTTESLNHLAHVLPIPAGHVIVTTLMEHHSNDLPWRRIAPVIHVGLGPHGMVDEAALERVLLEHKGRVALLAVSGASNVTGTINPVHRWARWAHAAGARIVVDAAQLVPHRPVDVRPPSDPEHLDFLAFSAHKMHAPFGTGVLIGPRADFSVREPRLVGGGTVSIVDVDRVAWAAAPDREEAGTPCITGALALAAAMREYAAIGWDAIVAHECALARTALEGLGTIPGVTIYGDPDPARVRERLAVLAFNVDGLPHALVSAILGEEWGIGTRSGCFCAHTYVKTLLGMGSEEARALETRIVAGDHSDVPGMVRASFGLASTHEDAERLVEAIRAIAAGRYQHRYALDEDGEYMHAESRNSFAEFFSP